MIARELHDVVAHNVSVIVAQSGAAQRMFDVAPEEGRVALRSIEDAGERRWWRCGDSWGSCGRADDRPDVRAPQPGLDELETLLSQVREAGFPSRLTVEGTPRPFPRDWISRRTGSSRRRSPTC